MLVDSAWAGDAGDIGILLYRVEVRTAEARDTIPDVHVATLPGVSSAGKVHMIVFNDDSNIPSGGEIYDPVARTVTSCRLNGDVEFRSQHPTISPDARYVAYVGWDNEMTENFGVIRRRSDSDIIASSPAEPWFEDDVDHNGVRWTDSRHAEFAYRSGRAKDLWVHATVSVDDRKVTVDTLSSQPVWAR
jgi:hypothetical protein